MLFNSLQFLIFFPIVCISYYLIPHRFRYLFLLAASYFFYMCWNPKYAILLFISTGITWLSGLFIERADRMYNSCSAVRRKKLYVALSFTSNLLILFFFKYFDFALDSAAYLLHVIRLDEIFSPPQNNFNFLLPVGISFYTFQALGYTMDVYRKDIPAEKNFLKYALFVSFFPQLVAGPIERSKNLLRQFHEKHSFHWENFRYGLIQMLFGFFQKVVISDNAAALVNHVYNDYTSYGSVELILATVLFAVQIYCDFGGYSNIAIGAARIMGFDLMENFRTPYMAASVGDFWRRWHISLSTWFRDYLYIPLGGNRKGKLRKYCNLMIVFLVSGLWHGASWHFVIWGALNGLYQVVENMTSAAGIKIFNAFHINRNTFSHRFGRGILTFILIDFSWIFFRASNVSQAFAIIKSIVTKWDPWVLFNGKLFKLGLDSKQFHMLMAAILVLVITDILTFCNINYMKKLGEQGIWFRFGVYFILIFWILIYGCYGPGYDASQFIYFQF